MKKLSKWIAAASVAIALIGVSFTSCSNLVDDATIDGGSTSKGAKSVTITATSQDDIVTFGNGSSRMIMPGQLDASSSDDYKFWLFGTNKTTGTSLDPKEVTFAAASGTSTKGTVALDLDIAQYELSLYVISSTTTTLSSESDAKAKAVLAATALADFTHSDTVNFYLTPYSLSANGAYDLKLYLAGWKLSSSYTSKVGIYSLTDGTAVSGATETTFYYNDDTDSSHTLKWTTAEPTSANFTSGSGYGVAPGTYNFIVTFTNSTTNKSYCYNDKIVILSNRRTTKTIAIPDVIDALPSAPSAFGVSYLNPVSTDDEYYEVQFEWTDGSYNETNFKLELIDFTEVSSTSDFEGYVKTLAAATGEHTAALDTAWTSFTTSSTDYSSKETQYNFTKKITKQTPTTTSPTLTAVADSFYNAPEFWVDGSFFINSTTATIRLPLEHRYLARLCAQNDAGDSDYVYADISGSTVTAKTGYKRYGKTAVAGTSLAKFGADASSINRFRIRYYLNGGKFYATTTPTTSAIPTPTGATQNDWADKTDKITGITPTKDAVVVYGTQRNPENLETSTNITNIFNPLLASTSETNGVAVLYQDINRWTGWLVGSVSGTTYTGSTNYNKVASATYSATDPAAVVYKDWDTSTNAISTKHLALGSTNIDLYATYRITSGNWYTDESAEYDIQDAWVKIYSSPTKLAAASISTGTEASSTNKSNGTYVYKKSNIATGRETSAPNAYYLYVLLANDGTNNQTKAGNGITYNTVAVDVLYKGTTSKARVTSSATTTVNYKLGGDSDTAKDITMSYAEIPLQSLPVGKYQIMIYAHADTQQGIYTYPIEVEIRDGVLVASSGSGSGSTFTASTKTFDKDTMTWTTEPDPAFGTITSVSSATESVLTASVDSGTGTVTLTSVAAGTSVVTISAGTCSVDVTFTVSATGEISRTASDEETTGAATTQGTLSDITLS